MNSFLAFLAKYLGLPLLKYIIEKVFKKIMEWLEMQQKIKEIKKKVKTDIKEIQKVKDARKKATMLNDYLSK